MAQKKPAASKLHKIDPVWERIRDEAAEIARIDPAMSGFIYAAVLNHDSFEAALIHRLANRPGQR